MFTGRRSFTKSSLCEGHFPFLTADSSVPEQQNILTICRPCISVYLSQYLTKLMHKICFTISFYFMSLRVSSTCAHHQEVKIALRSLWYHHTYRLLVTASAIYLDFGY